MWTFGLGNVEGRSHLEEGGCRWEGVYGMFVKEVGVVFRSPALQPPQPHSKKRRGKLLCAHWKAMLFTQQNAVDLHRVGTVP